VEEKNKKEIERKCDVRKEDKRNKKSQRKDEREER